jgi:hypothetical protein
MCTDAKLCNYSGVKSVLILIIILKWVRIIEYV